MKYFLILLTSLLFSAYSQANCNHRKNFSFSQGQDIGFNNQDLKLKFKNANSSKIDVNGFYYKNGGYLLDKDSDLIFKTIQQSKDLNNDHKALAYLEPSLIEIIKHNNYKDNNNLYIKNYSSKIINYSNKGTKIIASVLYESQLIDLNGNVNCGLEIKEIWHFIYEDKGLPQDRHWLLIGINQI